MFGDVLSKCSVSIPTSTLPNKELSKRKSSGANQTHYINILKIVLSEETHMANEFSSRKIHHYPIYISKSYLIKIYTL